MTATPSLNMPGSPQDLVWVLYERAGGGRRWHVLERPCEREAQVMALCHSIAFPLDGPRHRRPAPEEPLCKPCLRRLRWEPHVAMRARRQNERSAEPNRGMWLMLTLVEVLGGPRDGDWIGIDAALVERRAPVSLRHPAEGAPHRVHVYRLSEDRRRFVHMGVESEVGFV